MNIFESVKQEMTRCWSDAAIAVERLFCDSRDANAVRETVERESSSRSYVKAGLLHREIAFHPLI